MSTTVILHITNEDPIVGEIDEMPSPTDTILVVKNPRKRDGKDLHYIDTDVTTVIWPWVRVNFLEILPSEEEERIIGFVRE
ncbi:MAG: hypothetical protein OEV06_02405 [Anaerolineae bacterium]|nr:hypothetical protein [Anaerolineae bacterium]